MYRLFLLPWFLQILVVGLTAAASEADPKKLAITDVGQADSDFALQGEYVGSIWEPCVGCVPVGLQVMARGAGKFEAVEYRCGLPGAVIGGASRMNSSSRVACRSRPWTASISKS